VLLQGDASEAAAWQRELERRYRPSVRIFNVAGIDHLPAALDKGAVPPGAKVVAWVCRGTACLPPIASLPAVVRELDTPSDVNENAR